MRKRRNAVPPERWCPHSGLPPSQTLRFTWSCDHRCLLVSFVSVGFIIHALDDTVNRYMCLTNVFYPFSSELPNAIMSKYSRETVYFLILCREGELEPEVLTLDRYSSGTPFLLKQTALLRVRGSVPRSQLFGALRRKHNPVHLSMLNMHFIARVGVEVVLASVVQSCVPLDVPTYHVLNNPV